MKTTRSHGLLAAALLLYLPVVTLAAEPRLNLASSSSSALRRQNEQPADGQRELTLKPGDTVLFPAGEVHTVKALTRMVLYRVQAGADIKGRRLDAWPAR